MHMDCIFILSRKIDLNHGFTSIAFASDYACVVPSTHKSVIPKSKWGATLKSERISHSGLGLYHCTNVSSWFQLIITIVVFYSCEIL